MQQFGDARDSADLASDAAKERRQPVTAGGADPRGQAPDLWSLQGKDAVMRIPVAVQIVLGSTRMSVSKLMGLTRGAIIPLDRKVGDLVDIVINDRIVARGEVVVLDEEASRFAVAVRDIVTTPDV